MIDQDRPLSGTPLSNSGILIGKHRRTAAFRILDANAAFCDASGWPIEALVDAGPRILWGPDFPSIEPLQRPDSSRVWSGPLVTRHRDSSAAMSMWQIAALPDTSGDETLLLCFQQEIGDIVGEQDGLDYLRDLVASTEIARQQSDALLAEILRVAADAIVVVDRYGRISEFNRGAEEMFGYGRDEIVGSMLDLLIPPETRAMHAHYLRGFGDDGRSARLMNERGDIVGLRRDGTRFPCQASIARVDDGNAVLYAAILRDLTETRRIESELRTARDRAEQGNIAKARFLATMSHELRTPLNAILGFSDVLRSEQFGPIGDAKYREYAGDIFAAGTHLFSLISDVMDFSLIDSGQLEPDPSAFGLVELVDEVTTTLAARAHDKGQTIIVDVPATLMIRADRKLLRQMLVNLVDNAVKFSDRPETIDVAAWREPSGALVLAIVDRGIGIAESAIGRVSEPFFQVDDSDTRRQQGIGIGLSLVRRIAELHGGRFELRNNPDRGVTAMIRLPASSVIGDMARDAGTPRPTHDPTCVRTRQDCRGDHAAAAADSPGQLPSRSRNASTSRRS